MTAFSRNLGNFTGHQERSMSATRKTEVQKISKDFLNQLASKKEVEATDESLKVDLGLLTVFDSSEVRPLGGDINQYIHEHGTHCIQQLVNKLFSLPSEPADPGRLATLPTHEFKLPREKPIPAQKAETTWEKFAKSKGIKNKKKSRMVYDDEKKEYMPRWGYKRGSDDGDNWLIEQKANDDDTTDPWKKLRDEKKERVAKNKKQQLKNLQSASGDRVLPGSIDLSSAAGKLTGKRNQQGKLKAKSHTDIALEVAQRSTNSMGKFDKKRAGEPSIRPAKKARRDNELQKPMEEKKQNQSVLNRVLGKQEESDKLFLSRAVHELGLNNIQKGELKTGGKGTSSSKKFKEKISAKGKGGKGGSFKGKGSSKGGSSKGKGKGKSSK